MSTERCRRLLLAIALLAVLTHVCAVPAHADPVIFPAWPAQAHGDAGHHHDGDGDAVHAPSCEAVSPAPIPGAVGVTGALALGDGDFLVLRQLVIAPRITVASELLPLFLLYASLLI